MKFIKLLQTIIASLAVLLLVSVLVNKLRQPASTYFPLASQVSTPKVKTSKSEVNKKEIVAQVESELENGSSDTETVNIQKEENINSSLIEVVGTIRPGDSFDSSMKRLNLSSELRREIISSFRPHLDFTRLDPKDKYYLRFNQDGSLLSCLYDAGPLESYLLEADYDGITVEKSTVELETKTVKISGKIDSSLFGTFAQMDEQPKLIYAFTDIFSSKLDFNTETKKGDQFSLIVDKYYRDNTFIGYGKIKLAEYQKSDGEKLRGYYYSSGDIVGAYFDEEGKEVGTSFLRSPVPMGRLTSGFTYRRKHPITGRVKSHLGIDLAAPVGTPILAASNGKIVSIGRKGPNGRQIILTHNGGYKTYYGHLSGYKKGLKVGSRVKKKDVIGYVGSSGLSTGPHLDYRIKHNGVFKNPFSIKVQPKSELSKSEIDNFNLLVSKMDNILSAYASKDDCIIEEKSFVLTPDRELNLL